MRPLDITASAAGAGAVSGDGDGESDVLRRMLGQGGSRTVDSETLISEVQAHVAGALESGYEYNTTLEKSDAFLRSRVLSRMSLVVMYVDLVGSTDIALELPVDRVATIISAFAQEMARVVTRHGGLVLKFVGDAVLAYFVADENSLRAADSAVRCAIAMVDVIKRGINPILTRAGNPELMVKIGLDYGTGIIVRYGADEQKSYVDILGPPMNIAAKIQARARPNQILVGHDVYSRLHPSTQAEFGEVAWGEGEWKYRSRESGDVYRVYGREA